MADLNFDILSWNVRGLGDYQKRRKLFNWVKKHMSKNPIVFMQETHSSDRNEKRKTMGTTTERINKIFSCNNLQ